MAAFGKGYGARWAGAVPSVAPTGTWLAALVCGLENSDVDGDTDLVSIQDMTSITSKELHEQTAAVLDRVKQGQCFRVMRGGEAGALLVPATDQVDPPWNEIMAGVRKARARHEPPRPNPVLAERRKRRYAAGLRR